MSATETEIDSARDLVALREIVADELATPVRPSIDALADEIRKRHGESVLGVLFYGSCLRKETDEGVLDFWVVVDDYDRAYDRRSFALVNRVAPPNVFYLEWEHGGTTLRTKYGVLDQRAFERGTSLASFHPYIWARFSQPARLLHCRDDEARALLVEAIAEATITLVARLVAFLPAQGASLRFSLTAFWREAFRRTYDSERRPEAEDSIRALYDVDAERYDRVALHAMGILAQRGFIDEARPHPRAVEICMSPGRQRAARLRWRMMRPFARTLGLLRLLKTAWTFGDWVPYVLWKLERHTGRRIEPTERQRRHPLIFGWPIILPLIFKRNLR